ncbi:MAG TPA: hypothetical protein DD653_00365 [Marinilabiliales bacterium]|jgi:hypothetical protein|nr:hypothetical protein [Marinilabiliales bacterium]
MFTFSESQYNEFDKFLSDMKGINWGTWPPNDNWPHYAGMTGYSLNQYEQDNGKVFVVVKFDNVVLLPDGRKGKRFHCGKSRNYQPNCERF